MKLLIRGKFNKTNEGENMAGVPKREPIFQKGKTPELTARQTRVSVPFHLDPDKKVVYHTTKGEPVTARDVHTWALGAGVSSNLKQRLTPEARTALGLK